MKTLNVKLTVPEMRHLLALLEWNHREGAGIGIELNPDYIKISEKRLAEVQVKLF